MAVVNPAYTDLLIQEIKSLPESYALEVLDFVGYLKVKAAKSRESCHLCAKHSDPITGEPRFNSETRKAIEEGDAILRGEIPAKRYNSLQEMLVDLESDD